MWESWFCKEHGLINSTNKNKLISENKNKLKGDSNPEIDNASADVSFFKIFQRIGNPKLVVPLMEFLRWVWKFLWAAIPVMLFDSFNHSWHNGTEEISTIRKVLRINVTNRGKHSSLSRHTLPRNGLTPLVFVFIFTVLVMANGLFNEYVFNLGDHLVDQVRTAYGIANFWSELWTQFNLPRNSPLTNNDIYRVLFLSLIIRAGTGLFELFLLLLSIGISLKIVFLLQESRFSESACVLESLRVLIELEREDALNSPLQKKYLMIRMNYLSSMSLLIPNNYLGNRYRKDWVNNQFKSISAFIQDRQSWLYAPGETTLKDLRRDFRMLAQMYIDGFYGTFAYSEEFWPKAVPLQRKWLQRISQLIVFLMPLGVILAALFFPDSFPISLQSPEIQGAFIWIGTAWLFIGIDRYLNFGVLDSIVDLASGLKGLR